MTPTSYQCLFQSTHYYSFFHSTIWKFWNLLSLKNFACSSPSHLSRNSILLPFQLSPANNMHINLLINHMYLPTSSILSGQVVSLCLQISSSYCHCHRPLSAFYSFLVLNHGLLLGSFFSYFSVYYTHKFFVLTKKSISYNNTYTSMNT